MVSDDRSVLRIGLAFAPIPSRGPIDRDSGQVDQALATSQQQSDHQGRRAVSQIDCPGDLPRSSHHHVHDLHQARFIVGDPARHQPLPVTIDDHDVVMTLASIDTGPHLLDTNHPILLRQRSG